MPTTLAQRIKAARSYADLRQQDIADACTAAGHKVSRKMRKVVIERSPSPGEPHEIFGIQVYPVSSPDEAAQALLRLTD